GLAGVRAVAAIAERGTIDEPRVERVYGLPVEAEAVERILAHVVHERVGGLDEAPQYLLAAFLLKVEGEGALVAIVVHEHRAETGARGRRRIAVQIPVDGLDLDHFGAEVAEELGREGPEHDRG